MKTLLKPIFILALLLIVNVSFAKRYCITSKEKIYNQEVGEMDGVSLQDTLSEEQVKNPENFRKFLMIKCFNSPLHKGPTDTLKLTLENLSQIQRHWNVYDTLGNLSIDTFLGCDTCNRGPYQFNYYYTGSRLDSIMFYSVGFIYFNYDESEKIVSIQTKYNQVLYNSRNEKFYQESKRNIQFDYKEIE